MSFAVAPAEVDFSDPGAPTSPLYGDAYPARAGALERARRIFLAGNGLPGRWQGRERFVIVETGFGLGHNFLATWDVWRRDPQRCPRLCFVSVEKHPLQPQDLARALEDHPLADLAAQLIAQWPPLTAGLHRLQFDNGQVELLLALGDAQAMAAQWVLEADAFYLDGFAPSRNPALWNEWLIKHLARQAAPGATAATWNTSQPLRRALAAVGFEVAPAPGSAETPDMTAARHAPRHTPQRPAGREPLAPQAREAVILGAGLAGAACALALAREGLRCTVVDTHAAPAQASSGNPAGLFHGTVNPDDGLHARFNRAAALATQRTLAGLGLAHQPGLLRLEHRLDASAMPTVPGYVHALDAEAASARAGRTLSGPAWFYPGGGALAPAAYVQALLNASGATLRLNAAVAQVQREGDVWQLRGPGGDVVAQAPLLVLAGGHGQLSLLADLAPTAGWTEHLTVQRGQLTHLAAAPWCPATPLAGDGYVIADGHGGVWCGATTEDGDADPHLRAECQHTNLTRYARLAGLAQPPEGPLVGRVGWRLLTPDRLPLIGGLPAEGPRAEQLRLQPRLPGLVLCTAMGSRGITWAALAGQLVAALAVGGPRPVEADLLDAVDPARLELRRTRRPGR
ncbi:FAD-dependent 5-carboxymethylaminomethyl-2-thiouridine(34) oxidoreductase MnmC [Roseateles sp. BYS87W]|uniref:tRNA 5-methylaminomethyl-2-thiouridine biosynthesis bifunctional protein MnmC n=1 Tax=Pelomonas baiyunensis TaxID=3299026 RepID=A0ABW7GWY6_9BURK